jgi:hypothetical protein
MVKRGKLPSGRRWTEFQAEWWSDGASRRRRQGRSVERERERERRREKERREEEERATRRFKYLSYANRTGATKSHHLLLCDWHPRVAQHMTHQSRHSSRRD